MHLPSPDVILYLPILLFSVIFHECSHGWVAERNGDPTARIAGRLTLNPGPHIDPYGTIILPLMTVLFWGRPFGWAKPVPVNVSNLRNPRLDGLKVALAGPASNLILATAFTLLLAGALRFTGPNSLLTRVGILGILVNCMLAIFNLVPVPPLDGSWMFDLLLPRRMLRSYYRIRPFGMLILILLIFYGPTSALLFAPIEFAGTLFLQLGARIAGTAL